MSEYYKEEMENFKIEAAKLKKEIPFFAVNSPVVTGALDLQSRMFTLMREMLTEIENFTGGQ